MKEVLFLINDRDGNKFAFQFENTHLVKERLIKRKEWGPFTKVGKLSPDGIQFLESNIPMDQAQFWEDYLIS